MPVKRASCQQRADEAAFGLRALAQDANPRAPIEAIVEAARPAGPSARRSPVSRPTRFSQCSEPLRNGLPSTRSAAAPWRSPRPTRQPGVYVGGYRRVRLDSWKVGVVLIEQHVRFVGRHGGWRPQNRCPSPVVPLVAERASRREVVQSQLRAIDVVNPLLLETGGDRHSHAHETRRKCSRPPVHEVFQYCEGVRLCRVYDPASGADPSTAPPMSSTAVEWWIALVNDSVGVPGGFRPEDHADPVR